MAKFGEGDPRWLVQKREDGTNVNQWHWTEKDCMPWSKGRLQELFGNLVLVDAGAKVQTQGVDSVTGDVFLNVRKAKLIPSYELSIKISWQGTTADGQAGQGFLDLPYVADENHDEDPEIRVVLPKEDKPSQELKEAILAGGKQVILNAIHSFVSELQSGVPAQHTTGTAAQAADMAPKTTLNPVSSAAAADAPSSNGTASSQRSTAAEAAGSKSKSSTRCTVKLTEQFYAKAEDIFECFVLQGRVQAFTRSPAVINPQPGGDFSWFNGHVQGTYQEMQPGQRLVLTWRFNNWEDGCYSKVVIQLSEPEPGNTVLSLAHTGLPEEDKFGHSDVQQQVEQGWKQQIFSSIKAVFGYGV